MQRLIEILGTGMGGFAAYVLSAFLITALVMGVMAVQSVRRLSRVRRQLSALQAVSSDET